MKNVWLRNKKSKFNLKSKILLEVLALAVVVGLGTAAQAPFDNTGNKAIFSPRGLFNPFTLTTVPLVANRGSSTGSSNPTMAGASYRMRPPIWVPARPPRRSPFRPPWPPGPPPWHWR